jgi:hypothetical protein
MGFLKAVHPSSHHYTYLLFLGGTVARMCNRLKIMTMLLEHGYVFDHIIYLVGERPLDNAVESPEKIAEHINRKFGKVLTSPCTADMVAHLQTESNALKWILEHIQLPYSLKGFIVASPMKKNAQGILVRPTTADTVHDWLATRPLPGSCLGISSQPFVLYQYLVLKEIMPQEFAIDMVGSSANRSTLKVGELLDTVARVLYQIQKVSMMQGTEHA